MRKNDIAVDEPKNLKVSARTWKKDGIDHVLVSSGEGKALKFNLPLPEAPAAIRSIEGGRAFNAGNRASIGLELPPYGFSFFSITR